MDLKERDAKKWPQKAELLENKQKLFLFFAWGQAKLQVWGSLMSLILIYF